jgi:hypothetical protein
MTTANFRAACVLIGCIAASTLVATALATPRGFVHASICGAAQNSDEDGHTRNAAGMVNTSLTTDIRVECPIPLTTDDGIPLPADPIVRIQVVDNSATRGVLCTSVVVNSSGDIVAISLTDGTSAAFEGDDELVNTMTAPASSVSAYVTECQVPRAESANDLSIIAHLRVE